ncbi:MAG: type IX secretion system membrane protein PorP/SprF [Bacteroidota bacterium]|nr:type IX secretion system membrane protein PorP/SprF [Bacteroidota bacterium]
MRKTKTFIILLIITMTLSLPSVYSQDPEFSQFYANPLYLNPALAGANICPRLTGNFRDQWPGLQGSFVTFSGSYDQFVNTLHGGLGLLLTSDRTCSGKLNTTTINLMYAYKFNLTDHLYASAALEAGYYQRHLKWEDLIFEDMIDPRTGDILPTNEKAPDVETIGQPDFSSGVFIGYDEIVYAGFSVSHLTEPRYGFYGDNTSFLYRKYTFHAGSVIDLAPGQGLGEREFSISPNVLYQQQGKFHQLNLGTYITFDPIIGGLWFRHNFENPDALIILAGIHYKSLRVGYSYDITLSRLSSVSGGSHEISASWQFPCIEKRRHIRAIKCPRF